MLPPRALPRLPRWGHMAARCEVRAGVAFMWWGCGWRGQAASLLECLQTGCDSSGGGLGHTPAVPAGALESWGVRSL